MTNIWPGIVCLSLSWLFLVPVYGPTHWAWIIFIIGGICCNCFALRPFTFSYSPSVYYLSFIVLSIYLILIPFPYNLGAGILLIGAIAAMLCSILPKLQGMTLGLLLSGFVVTIQALVFPCFFRIAVRYHYIDTLLYPSVWLMKAFGLNVTVSQTNLFVQTHNGVVPFATTIGNMGLFTLLPIIIGALL